MPNDQLKPLEYKEDFFPLAALPDNCLKNVLGHLDKPDVNALAATSKKLRRTRFLKWGNVTENFFAIHELRILFKKEYIPLYLDVTDQDAISIKTSLNDELHRLVTLNPTSNNHIPTETYIYVNFPTSPDNAQEFYQNKIVPLLATTGELKPHFIFVVPKGDVDAYKALQLIGPQANISFLGITDIQYYNYLTLTNSEYKKLDLVNLSHHHPKAEKPAGTLIRAHFPQSPAFAKIFFQNQQKKDAAKIAKGKKQHFVYVVPKNELGEYEALKLSAPHATISFIGLNDVAYQTRLGTRALDYQMNLRSDNSERANDLVRCILAHIAEFHAPRQSGMAMFVRELANIKTRKMLEKRKKPVLSETRQSVKLMQEFRDNCNRFDFNNTLKDSELQKQTCVSGRTVSQEIRASNRRLKKLNQYYINAIALHAEKYRLEDCKILISELRKKNNFNVIAKMRLPVTPKNIDKLLAKNKSLLSKPRQLRLLKTAFSDLGHMCALSPIAKELYAKSAPLVNAMLASSSKRYKTAEIAAVTKLLINAQRLIKHPDTATINKKFERSLANFKHTFESSGGKVRVSIEAILVVCSAALMLIAAVFLAPPLLIPGLIVAAALSLPAVLDGAKQVYTGIHHLTRNREERKAIWKHEKAYTGAKNAFSSLQGHGLFKAKGMDKEMPLQMRLKKRG